MTLLENTATATPALAGADGFAPESRVWVYTCNRPLDGSEAGMAQQALDAFTRQWTAHDRALQAAGEIFDRQFAILMVDESRAGASGCSIDKSVHFLEQLGQELGVDFFERMRFAWLDNGNLHYADRNGLSEQVANGSIGPDTLMVNTLAQTKQELSEKWLLPFGKSWHRRLV